MLKSHRSFLGAAVAFALAVPFALPAAAAPGKVCYFSECIPESAPGSTATTYAPGAPAPSEQSRRVLGRHGNWTALVDGPMQMIVDEFDDGSAFGVATGNGKSILLMSSPKWSLAEGQTANVTITIDGRGFSGTGKTLNRNTLVLEDVSPDFLRALYNGRKAHIAAGSYSADMLQLTDAKAAIDDIAAFVQTSQQ
jgi:hypothetical protein